MNSRERMIKTLNHEEVDRIPRDLWCLPYIPKYKKINFHKLIRNFQEIFQALHINMELESAQRVKRVRLDNMLTVGKCMACCRTRSCR